MTAIDWNKPVQTKDGRKFFYVGRGPNPQYPIVGYLDGWTCPGQWTEEGLCAAGHAGGTDLINVPEKHEIWVNLYKSCQGKFYLGDFTHVTKRDADDHASANRIACIRIEFEEGEGLS